MTQHGIIRIEEPDWVKRGPEPANPWQRDGTVPHNPLRPTNVDDSEPEVFPLPPWKPPTKNE